MRVLITGGAGFIGSHTSQRLVQRGDTVLIIDDLNDFYSPDLKLNNLEDIRRTGTFEFIEGDIRDTCRMAEITARFSPDLVIHLAARAGVRPSLSDPLLYEQVNVAATIGLLEACRRLDTVPKVVFASSSSIYGIANRVPFSEEDGVNLPISPYAATKIAGEKICYTYSHLYDIPVVCLRFFTVYGPRQRPDLAIRKFLEMVSAGKPIPVFGDGTTGRDYTFIDDIVDGILAAAAYGCSYEVFNLGNSHPVTLTEMIRAIEGACGREAKIDRLPPQAGDVPITYADISKARRLLGYDPKVPFPEGIRRFSEWYEERRGRVAARLRPL